jgi:hypothetical protein
MRDSSTHHSARQLYLYCDSCWLHHSRNWHLDSSIADSATLKFQGSVSVGMVNVIVGSTVTTPDYSDSVHANGI